MSEYLSTDRNREESMNRVIQTNNHSIVAFDKVTNILENNRLYQRIGASQQANLSKQIQMRHNRFLKRRQSGFIYLNSSRQQGYSIGVLNDNSCWGL